MTLKHFIERPVLASVISIVIVIAGLIGLATLPVEQYPDIAPPTVMVRASYPGASAETIQKSVIVPLEQAINGVEDMTYMTSSAAVGSASVTVYFRQGTNADMAAVNVQNKVSRATGQLPPEVTQIGVTTMKRQTSMVKIFSLYSPDDSYDETFLSNYLKINVEPRIQRIRGVGEVFTLGAEYSMRVWLKPDVMAQYKLIPSDVTAALAEQNIESATGTLGENSQNTFQYTMKYRGRHQTPEEFGEIVLLSKPDGTLLRLKDIADIELGSESYAYKGYTNGHPGVSTMIFQTAGSNATQVVNDVNALLDELQAELPKGIAIAHLQSVNDFLYASMKEVVKTLFEAILLVILVVYVFLQDIRSTLIPTVSILVALVGTFGFLAFAGFSINLLTLFALVLAIGTVVDDAIIVVLNRKAGSGTRATFEAAVFGDEANDFKGDAELDKSGDVQTQMASTDNAISYLDFSHFDDSKFNAIKVEGVEPKSANVTDDSFKIWATEHMYCSKHADEATTAFLEFMLSDDVQGKLVEEQGFIPVSAMKVVKDASGKVSAK